MPYQTISSACIPFRSSSMNSLILPGAKFVMDTAIGKRSYHLELSMVFGDCICHDRTFPIEANLLSNILSWCVEVQFLRLCADSFCSSPRFSEGFFWLSSVYPCCITIFKNLAGVSGSWWVLVSEIVLWPWREKSSNPLGWLLVESSCSCMIAITLKHHKLQMTCPQWAEYHIWLLHCAWAYLHMAP